MLASETALSVTGMFAKAPFQPPLRSASRRRAWHERDLTKRTSFPKKIYTGQRGSSFSTSFLLCPSIVASQHCHGRCLPGVPNHCCDVSSLNYYGGTHWQKKNGWFLVCVIYNCNRPLIEKLCEPWKFWMHFALSRAEGEGCSQRGRPFPVGLLSQLEILGGVPQDHKHQQLY